MIFCCSEKFFVVQRKRRRDCRTFDKHFDEIRNHASDIEERIDDSDCTVDWIKEDNIRFIEGFENPGTKGFGF
jgi:hypothetical protein